LFETDCPLPPPLPTLLPRLLAASAGARLALVGGALRDLLLHRWHRDPWREVTDLDLVVEVLPASAAAPSGSVDPPAHGLVKRFLAQLDPGAVSFCRFHQAYGTVELELALPDAPGDAHPERVLLDVATARAERYPAPAENPQVSFGRLEDDLARRDFTVNAMALVLTPDGVHLLDPHRGASDLQARQLRLLHAHSLVDDPTRLVRAARYGARLGFTLEAGSLMQARTTLRTWPWPWRPGDPAQQAPPALGTRLRMELELLLEHEPWPQALALLQRWDGLLLLDPALQADTCWSRRLQWAARAGLPQLVALLAGAADPAAVAARLQLPHRQQRLLQAFVQLRQQLQALEPQACHGWSASAWSFWLEQQPRAEEVVPLALACGLGPRRPLLRWWLLWRHVDAGVRAQDLIAAGIPAGPALGQRLRELRRERLEQVVRP
jgi:poly(A) polymerase